MALRGSETVGTAEIVLRLQDAALKRELTEAERRVLATTKRISKMKGEVEITAEIDQLEREAKKAHAQLNALEARKVDPKVTLDTSALDRDIAGVRARLAALDRTRTDLTVSLTTRRDTDRQLARLTSGMQKAQAASSTLLRPFSQLDNNIAKMTLRIGPFTASLTQWATAFMVLGPAIANVAGALGALTGAIGGGILGVTLQATAAFSGFALAAAGIGATLKSTVKDIKSVSTAQNSYNNAVLHYGKNSEQADKKLKQLNKTLEGISPIARKGFLEMGKLGDSWRKLTDPTRLAIMDTMGAGLKTLRDLMPTLASRTNQAATALGKGLQDALRGLRSKEGRGIIDEIMGNFNATLPRWISGFNSLGVAFGRVMAVASRFLELPASNFAGWAKGLADATKDTDGLEKGVRRLVNAGSSLWRFLSAGVSLIGAFFNRGIKPGTSALDAMTQRLREWTAAAREGKFDKFFSQGVKETGRWLRALGPLVTAFGRLVATLQPFASLAARIFTPMAKLLNKLMDFAPTAAIIQGVGAALAGAFVVSKIMGAVGAVRALVGAVGGFKQASITRGIQSAATGANAGLGASPAGLALTTLGVSAGAIFATALAKQVGDRLMKEKSVWKRTLGSVLGGETAQQKKSPNSVRARDPSGIAPSMGNLKSNLNTLFGKGNTVVKQANDAVPALMRLSRTLSSLQGPARAARSNLAKAGVPKSVINSWAGLANASRTNLDKVLTATRRNGVAITKTMGTHSKNARLAAVANFDMMVQGVSKALTRGQPLTTKKTRSLISAMRAEIGKLPPSARKHAEDSMVKMSQELEKKGRLPKGTTARMRDAIVKMHTQLRDRAVRRATEAGRGVSGNFANMGNAVGGVISQFGTKVNSALGAFGAKKISFKTGKAIANAFKGFKGFNRGGMVQFGRPGARGGDNIPLNFGGQDIMVGSGEMGLVLNAEQQAELQARTADVGGIDGFFSRYNSPHGYARGGQVAGRKRFAGGGIVSLGRKLQRMGYQVGEHPAFGGVAPVHTQGSYHYRGAAIDVNADGKPGGEAKWLDRLAAYLRRVPGIAELIWRAPNHYDHLHVAIGGGKNFVDVGGMGGPGGGGLGPAPQIGKVNIGGTGPLSTLGNAAVEKVRAAANKKLGSEGGVGPGGVGKYANWKGAWPELMAKIAQERGWNLGHWKTLVNKESGGNPAARNPSSGAFGLGQFLGGTLEAYRKYGAGSSSGVDQIRAMAQYIADRYGSPTKALGFHLSHNWYRKGGKAGRRKKQDPKLPRYARRKKGKRDPWLGAYRDEGLTRALAPWAYRRIAKTKKRPARWARRSRESVATWATGRNFEGALAPIELGLARAEGMPDGPARDRAIRRFNMRRALLIGARVSSVTRRKEEVDYALRRGRVAPRALRRDARERGTLRGQLKRDTGASARLTKQIKQLQKGKESKAERRKIAQLKAKRKRINDRIKKARKRIASINKRLRNPRISRGERRRLLAERTNLFGSLTQLQGDLNQAREDTRGPTELDRLEAGLTRAQVETPGTADDIAAQRKIVGYWERTYAAAKRGGDPGRIREAGEGLLAARSALGELMPAPGGGGGTTDTGDDRALSIAQAEASRLKLRVGQLEYDRAFAMVAGGPGDIGAMGFGSGRAAAMGFGGPTGQTFVINTLHPGDPATLRAVAGAATAGIGYQGFAPSGTVVSGA